MKSIIFCSALSISSFYSIAQVSIIPANPQNPYDYVGANHNAGLDYIIKKYPNMSFQFFNENWKAIVADFLTVEQQDAHSFINTMSNPQIDQKCGTFSFYTSKTPEDELKQYLNDGLISKFRYDKAIEVYELVNGIDGLLAEAGGNAAKAYSIFYDRMLKIESGYRTLPADDKMFCYSVSSLARSSVAYWLSESIKSRSAWHVPNSRLAGMFFSWKQLCLSDAGGAVTGIVRVGVGVLFGGVAGLGALGAAAVGGGIAASAGYVFSSLFGG